MREEKRSWKMTASPPPLGRSWKRPDAVAGRGQVKASGVVPSRPHPGLGEKHELYVFVGDEGVNFCSFLGTVNRTSVEQSDRNIDQCPQMTYQGQAETNAEAWFSISLRPRKPLGSLGRTAQDRGHLDSHTDSSSVIRNYAGRNEISK